MYTGATLRDWQLELVGPARILDEAGGRQRLIADVIRKEEACYQGLTILKATRREGSRPVMAGYVMFEVHAGGGGSHLPNGRWRPVHERKSQAWAELKQIFVLQHMRRHRCGTTLFTSMLRSLNEEEHDDVCLNVLDFNVMALHWYRSRGFVVVGLTTKLLGPPETASVIVYERMRRCAVPRDDFAAVPCLFKQEVVQELVTINYPDNSGIFDVRIVGYNNRQRWHKVDSEGLEQGTWIDDSFTDEVDLNLF